MQKQKIKRKYAQAAREAQKTAQHTQKVLTTTGKIIRAVQQFAAAHKSVLLIVAMLALVISFFSAGLASCTAMLSGAQSSFLSATYLADEQEICNSELYFTELEADLQLDISSTEANYPGYDEYRYNIGEISHNPYELMSYLSATYGVFTFEQVRPELDRLFGAKYQLTRTPITETRYDDDGQPYEWTVLQTTLTVGRLGDTIAASLTPGEQTERYQAYMEGCGNCQAYGNPFDFPWLGYVSSGYGWRVHPITGVKDLHRGVDIAAAQGTAIKAIQDGRVVSAGDMGSYGLCMVIEDGQGYQSRYAHCSSLNVSAGQEVKRGDVIGAVGSAGNSTGPHLHLEVMLNGEYLNPYYFVETGGSGETVGPVIPDYSGEPMDGDRFQAMLIIVGLSREPKRVVWHYWLLLHTSGRAPSDYVRTFVPGAVLVNTGVNCLIATWYIVFKGGDLNGATIGAIFTVMGFSAYGKHAFNILPIMAGVLTGSLLNHVEFNNPSLQSRWLPGIPPAVPGGCGRLRARRRGNFPGFCRWEA